MRTHLGCILAIIITLSTISGCTRDRATGELGTVTTSGDVTPALIEGTEGEPEVATTAPTTESNTDSTTDSNTAPATAPQIQPDPTNTPQPDSAPETLQYTVSEGDTIASIADKYGTDIDSLRQMNFLVDDNIFVGQVLRVPLLEGYTAEGKPTPTPEPLRYVVQPGDSLLGIAVQFDVSPADLIAANNIVDQNNIPVGQSLLIPGSVQITPPVNGDDEDGSSGGQAVHVVGPGETLGTIAELYGVDVGELATANNIANRDLLRVGQRLFIPGLTPRQAAAATQIVHVVKSGEGLLQIAEFYGVSAAEISALNQIQNTDLIYPGQELLIPDQ